MIKVLFVCMGNICRSPTAHGLMQHLVDQRDLNDKIYINSAGTHAYHVDQMADNRSRATAATRGIDMDSLRARKISVNDYDEFDYILAMDKENLRLIEYYAPPNPKAKMAMFLSFANAERATEIIEVPDPYYGGADGFENVFDLVQLGCEALIDELVPTK